jgi:hypothetical protein
MPATITTDQVWREIEAQMFAVLGHVTPKGEPRTSGIVYTVRNRRLYIGVYRESWKPRHIARYPRVSVTVTLPKRIPFMPWVKLPPATISFQGTAEVMPFEEADAGAQEALQGGGVEHPPDVKMDMIKITPAGEFLTYGVGVSMSTMRRPDDATGRAAV